MFLSYRVEVTDHLRPLDENILLIEFESALLRGRDLEKSHPEYNFIAHNGESGRLGVRKAQYHWVRFWNLHRLAATDRIGMGLGSGTYVRRPVATYPS
jgi:hypothetical protein